ncbi:hypothetical protein B0H14DRAFT_3460680 [Mycena olivaceomarginata]|nr:hypothetical protein B0H14DRAFT_3460680 [Mycena olivaceomarginata]
MRKLPCTSYKKLTKGTGMVREPLDDLHPGESRFNIPAGPWRLSGGFPDETVRILTVIEAPTIHQIRVRYCKCTKSDQADNLEQLLRNSWYPVTVTDPKTCATFRSLEAYRLYNVVGNLNVSSCIVFAALLQKDTRLTTGLRVSGVGGVVCARYECMQANRLGDLQKGERYSNMDYIIMSVLIRFMLLWLTLSYDIACQWKVRLPERMKKLPDAIQLPLDDIKLQGALPVWHASSTMGIAKTRTA